MSSNGNSSEAAPLVTAPQNVPEVEELVQRLYRPASAALIQQINVQLQKVQLSPDGWKVADQLLGSEDANVRFFAALTFMVKLNNDGHSLDAEAAITVLARLVYWLVRSIDHGEGPLVSKKLCSALTTYFVQSPVRWERPLYHLALCFHHGDVVQSADVPQANITMSALISSLKHHQLVALLWFAGTLAEEVGKVDTNAQKHARLHAQMEEDIKDAGVLMAWSLQQIGSPARLEALHTFLAWINYAQPVWPRKPEALEHLRALIGPAAECISYKELSTEALDIFRDILESYTSFFRPQHMAMLAELIYTQVREPLERALFQKESDGQHVLYGQFVIAFGCANIQQVVEEPGDQLGSREILDLHLKIISAEGYPGDDDQLSVQSIEFWNTYIEYVNDILFSKGSDEPDPDWLSQAKFTLQQAFHLLWKKCITPPSDIAQEWGDDEHAEFKEFRLDTADLLLSIFLLLGREMLEQIVQLFSQSLEAHHWHAVEASLFCLNTLSDNVLEVPTNEAEVGKIFRSSLFKEMLDFSLPLPPQTRRTAIDLLGCYGEYIERHAEFLPDSLRFLFASLETAGLANAAAKSIASLCSTCRMSLTNELPDFLAQYQRFLQSSTSDAYTKEKVIGAIAAIVQAKTPESSKVEPLMALLEQIEKDVAAAKQYAADGDQEMVETVGVSALECLASIGRGLQVPEDIPIDIYDDDDKGPGGANFWESEDGRAVQQRIVGCFSVLQVVGNYSAAIDAACQVLRTGYTETTPGPFVLPSSVTVSFVQQCIVTTPQLETVLSTASMWITQQARQKSENNVETEVRAIHDSVVGFARALHQPSSDPAVAMGCIEVFTRLMPRYTHILLGDMASAVLNFILTAIVSADQLPKKSACEFWTKLVKPPTAALSPNTLSRQAQVIKAYGPQLAECLVRQIGGQAQRSELDFLCEPLKALFLQQPETQGWMQLALGGEGFPNPRIGVEERQRFLKQLVGVRSDGKKMKEIVRTFWAACRGTVVSYRS